MWKVIHFVDVARVRSELRPLCGAWHDDVTWTTLRAVVTCPACARLLREPRPERRRPPIPSFAPDDRSQHERSACRRYLV